MKQVNTSGAAVHVPCLELGRLVGPGEEVDADKLLPGFSPVVVKKQAAPRAKKAAKKRPEPAVDAAPKPDPTAVPTEDDAAPAAEKE